MSSAGRSPAAGSQRDLVRLDAFLDMMAAERGAARNTLEAYHRDLDDFFQQTGRLADAGAEDIRVYLSDLAARRMAPSSQARKLSALRQFFRFQLAEGERADDPTQSIDSPSAWTTSTGCWRRRGDNANGAAYRQRGDGSRSGRSHWSNFSTPQVSEYPSFAACHVLPERRIDRF